MKLGVQTPRSTCPPQALVLYSNFKNLVPLYAVTIIAYILVCLSLFLKRTALYRTFSTTLLH